MKYFVKYLLSPLWGFGSALASIIGLIIVWVNKEHAWIIILVWLCILLLAVIAFMYHFINTILQRFVPAIYPEDYEVIFIHQKFRSDDRTHGEYDTFKAIQCKRMSKSNYIFEFKWTGKTNPGLASSLQDIGPATFDGNANKMDNIALTFKQPLKFNDCEVVHINFKVSDEALVAKPWMSTKVKNNTKVIHYQVELRYKANDYNKEAVIERTKMEANVSELTWEHVNSVPFINSTYQFAVLEPNQGYIYRIKWEW